MRKERELQGDRLLSLCTSNVLHIFPFVKDTFQAHMRLYGGGGYPFVSHREGFISVYAKYKGSLGGIP